MTSPDRLLSAIRAALDDLERFALAASPGPWDYNSYSAVFSGPKVHPEDEWLDSVLASGEGHTLERHGPCPVCGDWKKPPYVPSPGLGHGCRHFDESYRLDPLVATVPAHHGDTAIGQHAADAAHIARHDPAAALRLVAADRRVLARHLPEMGIQRAYYCRRCHVPVSDPPWPCDEIRDLADRLGIDPEETDA